MTQTTPCPTGLSTTGDALRRACRDLGLADGLADQLLAKLLDGSPATAAAAATEPATCREVEMMQLLKTPSPDRLVHDLRNVLNELMLLKATADL